MSICVLGDSHARIFDYCNTKQNKYIFDVCAVSGATAQGCVNPNSKTNALPIFVNKIKTANTKYEKIMIMLGEVDCGFLIWVRSKRYGISVDAQLDLCIANLFNFIQTKLINSITSSYSPNEIIILGIHLPTIKDNTKKQLLAGARSEVNVSQYDRTQKTLQYNNILKQKSAEAGYNYIDITDEIIGTDGIVKPYYLNANPYDHHLESDKIYHLWLKKLL